MAVNDESRVALRLPITLRIRLGWRGGVLSCFSANVSAAGMFVETSTDIPVGEEVQLAFTFLHDDQLHAVAADGEVVRRIDEEDSRGLVCGLGIRLIELQRGEDALVGMISRRLWELRASRASGRGEDRREFPRVDVGLPVYWGREKPPTREAFLRNLSARGGFVLEARTPVPRGERLHVWFDLPVGGTPQQIHVQARVARVVTDRRFELEGVGVELVTGSRERAIIEQFVAQRLGWEQVLREAAPEGLSP
jgi:Tfp pilus assembly protein PilZ